MGKKKMILCIKNMKKNTRMRSYRNIYIKNNYKSLTQLAVNIVKEQVGLFGKLTIYIL